jgi:hypothetical protein
MNDDFEYEPIAPEFLEKLREVSDQDAETKAKAMRMGLEEYDLDPED